MSESINLKIQQIDEFLADSSKRLDEPQPAWKYTGRSDWQCTWPIVEDNGLIRANLKLRMPEYGFSNPSIGLIFSNEMVARLDRAKDSICEINPPYAARIGLPPKVCGMHVHKWEHNREHVIKNKVWELPAREPVTDNITKITQMCYWFCDYIKVTIPTECRVLHLPDRGLWSNYDA